MVSDTIVAVSSPPGRGGIGIVRVAGPAAREILAAITGRSPSPRHAAYAEFHDLDGAIIDSGVALYFPAPHSYSGDDIAELQGHGNPIVLQQILRRACALGARPARAGEFTERAFRNGKLDLSQAEAVADLIASQSVRAARSAMRTLRGAFATAVDDVIAHIQRARADLEASIDFADELHALALVDQQRHALASARQALSAVIARARQGARLSEGANIAIVGAPNVGKSSLLNRLADDDRAIVSPQPGTTRDTVETDVVIAGIPLRLIDTAGLRDSVDPIENAGMARARRALERADLVLLVTDQAGHVDAIEAWRDLCAQVPADVTPIVVHNKIDLSGDAAGRRGEHGTDTVHVFVSALTGAGLDELSAAIACALGVSDDGENEFTAHARQLDALARAENALATIDVAHLAETPELVAEHYRDATTALETISARYSSEDLLGDIFARFCIGK